MKDFDVYKNKFSERGLRVLEGALNEQRRRNQNFISPEHILYALMIEEPDLFEAALRNLPMLPQAVRAAVEKRLENCSQHAGEGFRLAPETTEIFKHSMDRARSLNRRVIDVLDLIHVFTRWKLNLLHDILQNPDKSGYGFKPNQTSESDRNYLLSQSAKLEKEQSRFFAKFTLIDLVKSNNSPSSLIFAAHSMGYGGGGGSGFDSEQITSSKQESTSCSITSPDFDGFDEAEFIASLKKDVEDKMIQSGLKITKSHSPNPSSFRLEYKRAKITGHIEISGELKDKYYQLQSSLMEKNIRKT